MRPCRIGGGPRPCHRGAGFPAPRPHLFILLEGYLYVNLE